MASVNVDPLPEVGGGKSLIRKDTLNLILDTGATLLQAAYSGLQGNAKRLLWRPPTPFQIVSAGDVHDDSRGAMKEVIGWKITFENKLADKVRVRVNVPIGDINSPSMIRTRMMTTDVTLDPAGTKKTETRKRKGKSKVYDVSTDRFSFDVKVRDLFRNDSNIYTLHGEKVPGDVVTGFTYQADGVTLGDFICIVPDISDQTGAALATGQDCIAIHAKVRYSVATEKGQGDVVSDTLNFVLSELADIKSMFHIDPLDLITPALGQVNVTAPTIITLPDGGYNEVGVKEESGKLALYWFSSGEPAAAVQLPSYEDADIRLIPLCFSFSHVYVDSDGWKSHGSMLEFAYDEEASKWYMSNVNGTPKDLGSLGSNDYNVQYTVDTAPFVVYNKVRPTLQISNYRQCGGRLYQDYGRGLSLSASFLDIIRGISEVVKVVQDVAMVAGALLG